MSILSELEQTYCDKCGKPIKKFSHYYDTQVLNEQNLQIKTGTVCEDCYHKYLIKILNKIDINVLDEDGNYRNFSDILQEFQDVWSEQINEYNKLPKLWRPYYSRKK